MKPAATALTWFKHERSSEARRWEDFYRQRWQHDRPTSRADASAASPRLRISTARCA
jgi:hypothetical protein